MGGENPRSTRPAAGRRRILVVDDERLMRDAAERMLTFLGYEVVACRGGREAIGYYREHGREIDLAVIDMTMPVMSGADCFRALKQTDPEVRALFSTGGVPDDASQVLMDEGILGVLQKPYTLTQLSDAVSKALRG